MRRAIGVPEGHATSAGLLLSLIHVNDACGFLRDRGTRRPVHSALSFAGTLQWCEGRMKVRDIMSEEVAFVPPNATLRQAAETIRDRGIGCLAVTDKNRVVGILTDRDLTCRGLAERRDPETTTVGEVMSTAVRSCRDEEEVVVAARRMERGRVRRLPVLDGEGRLVGLLSLSDVARIAPHRLSGQVLEVVSSRRPQPPSPRRRRRPVD